MFSIGIVGMELYVPKYYLDLAETELFDHCRGKYTCGLGQKSMSVLCKHENAISMALTVTYRILQRKWCKEFHIGCIEVGSESNIDRSKPIKSYLMDLFPERYDIDGCDSIFACYGGTSALLKAYHWLALNPKRISNMPVAALVIMTDISDYGESSAKATGGAGSIAVLISSENPCLIIEDEAISRQIIFSKNERDFFRPIDDPYPVVNGPLSLKCYFEALHNCYESWKEFEMSSKKPCDIILFHCPFVKLAEKASSQIGQDCSSEVFKNSLKLSSKVGNIYCGSLYMCIYSLFLHSNIQPNFRIGLFSYGSGLMSRIFSLKVNSRLNLSNVDLTSRVKWVKDCNHEQETGDLYLYYSDKTPSYFLKQRKRDEL